MKLTKKIKKEFIFEILLFSTMVILAYLFYNNNILLSVSIILLWIIGIKFWHKTEDIFFFIGGATVPMIGEIVCVSRGVWQYSNPTFLGVPLWLPFGWGLTAAIIKRTAETLTKIMK